MRWLDGHPTISVATFVMAIVGLGFILALATCAIVLPLMKRLQVRQHAYADAPASHQAKTGTPTMGGLCFTVALLPCLFFAWYSNLPQLFFLVLTCGAVGFVDDFLGVRLGRNRGLRARTKLLSTALLAVIFLRMIGPSDILETRSGMKFASAFPIDSLLTLPGYSLHAPHWLWLILGIAAITGTIHAVNLTDGLDGLATGTMIAPLAALAIVSTQPFANGPGAIAALFGIGACLAFLIYNWHPAKIFMGDTGSLALGALLSGVAILSGEMLLLIVVGGVFVAEALSVMLQVAYFKATGGKRIFRMSPLHHHFELLGWPETKVTMRFWLASAVLSGIGLAIVR